MHWSWIFDRLENLTRWFAHMKPFNIFALLTLNSDRVDVYTFVMLRWFRVNMNFKPFVNSSGVVWISSHHGHVRECAFRNPANFCMLNLGSWNFLLVESGILGLWIRNTAVGIWNPFLPCFITIGIRNPSSTGKDLEPSNCKPKSMAWKQNPRVSWISLHGENLALVSSVSQASVPSLCTDPPPPPLRLSVTEVTELKLCSSWLLGEKWLVQLTYACVLMISSVLDKVLTSVIYLFIYFSDVFIAIVIVAS